MFGSLIQTNSLRCIHKETLLIGPVLLALRVHQRIHETQVSKGITSVDHFAGVHLPAILLDETRREGSTTEDHRYVDSRFVEGLKVVLHEGGGLHQQSAHRDAISLVLLLGLNDRITALLDPEVDHLITIVGEDDVHQIFADVVHIAFDGGNQKLAFTQAFALFFFHVWLEMSDSRLHRFGALQHKRKLHLTTAEQLTDNLHAIQQEGIDDLQRWIGLKRVIEGWFQTDALAIDDVLLEPLFDRQIRQGRT